MLTFQKLFVLACVPQQCTMEHIQGKKSGVSGSKSNTASFWE